MIPVWVLIVAVATGMVAMVALAWVYRQQVKSLREFLEFERGRNATYAHDLSIARREAQEKGAELGQAKNEIDELKRQLHSARRSS